MVLCSDHYWFGGISYSQIVEGHLRLGVDLDGVGYAWDKTARFLLKWHKEYTLPPSSEWDSIQNSISKEDWKWLWSDAITQHGLYRHGHILKGYKEALDLLAIKHKIVLITARPKIATIDTLDWLAFHRIPTQELHILGKEPKSSIPCDIYIDDGPHNLAELASNSEAKLICWDRPYNQGIDCDIRTNDWKVAIEFIS